MKTIELNIGLNNNPYDYEYIADMLMKMYDAKVQKQIGRFFDDIEPTAVAVFRVPDDYKVIDMVERMSYEFTQESIAVKIDGIGQLVFNPAYSGDGYPFDEKYFLSFIYIEFQDIAKDTRGGFYHKSTLYVNGVEYDSARVSYVNRTWESYCFETSRKRAYEKSISRLSDNEKLVIEAILKHGK